MRVYVYIYNLRNCLPKLSFDLKVSLKLSSEDFGSQSERKIQWSHQKTVFREQMVDMIILEGGFEEITSTFRLLET